MCRRWRARLALFALLIAIAHGLQAQEILTYQTPPQAIVDLVDTRPTPSVDVSRVNQTGKRWLLIEPLSGLPPLSDLAQPELRLAGLRFNPRTNGPSRGRYVTSLRLKLLPDGAESTVAGIPPNAQIRFVAWAPDAHHVSFVNTSNDESNAVLSLWIVDVSSGRAQQLPGIALNGIFGAPCEWRSDSTSLVCKTLPKNRGQSPVPSDVPSGPVVQENLGRVTPGPTYQDLLKNPVDEKIFNYYATSQVELIQLDGTVRALGKPGVIESASPSPDGRYVLVDERHPPYSYLLPYPFFPESVSVIDMSTGGLRQIVDKPLEDTIPNVHDAVEPGPRDFGWRSDVAATLAYAEARDGGDPRKEATVRDTVFFLDAPFDGKASKLVELPLRSRTVIWGDGHLALVEEVRWKDRKRVILAVAPDKPGASVQLFDGSFEDRYHDPGKPFTAMNASGKQVLETTEDGSGIYLHARGASPEGDRPFVAGMNVTNGDRKKIWESTDQYYEFATAVLTAAEPTLLVRRESPQLEPNYYVKNLATDTFTQVTQFPNPYGNAKLPKKKVLKYQRADGVDLSANLYLPPRYKKEDGPLPTLMEAYPTEYKTKSAAGQISGSPYEFPFLNWGSPIPFVTQGYAVLENATIPIVGEGQAEPNDTYVEQLVASAQAAIDEGVRLGVVDRNRVAVMGHSYGAFMTANLLAHGSLFKAGIARSGAYNRTLTPFGFQNEDRTYWQAPQVYYNMSPFSFADKIKTPILLIHGEADNNTGTFPIQSERLFSAIKGQGGTVRFVLLPLESHGYAGRESVLHMYWEMNQWMNTYVKNASSTPTTATGTAASK